MKTILYMAQSLDGFIAGANDETPWSDEEWNAFNNFVRSVDNLIMGFKTYEIMIGDGSIKDLNASKVVVLSHNSIKDVSTIKKPQEILGLNGNTFAVIGGSQANNAFLSAGLIDEAVIDIENIVLGSGIKLGWTGNELLTLIDSKQIGPQTMQLRYKVAYE